MYSACVKYCLSPVLVHWGLLRTAARPNWLLGWQGALGLCEVDFALLAPARAQGRGVAKVPEPPPRVPRPPGLREKLLDGLGGSARVFGSLPGRRAASVGPQLPVVLERERAAIHRSVPAFLEQHVSWVLLAAPAVLL